MNSGQDPEVPRISVLRQVCQLRAGLLEASLTSLTLIRVTHLG